MMEAVVVQKQKQKQKQNQKRKRFRKALAMGCALALLGGGFAWTAEPAPAAPVALYASPGGSGTVCSSSLPCFADGRPDQSEDVEREHDRQPDRVPVRRHLPPERHVYAGGKRLGQQRLFGH